MKTVYCDFCGQQLTEAEVEGTARLPPEPRQRWWKPDDELVMFPQIRRRGGGALDAGPRHGSPAHQPKGPVRIPRTPGGRAEAVDLTGAGRTRVAPLAAVIAMVVAIWFLWR